MTCGRSSANGPTRGDANTLRIAAAAIRVGQMVYALPPPARHHTIMWRLAGLNDDCEPVHTVVYEGHVPREHEQGFITNRGMFVDRAVALEIATQAGQLIGPPRGVLFSEEVW